MAYITNRRLEGKRVKQKIIAVLIATTYLVTQGTAYVRAQSAADTTFYVPGATECVGAGTSPSVASVRQIQKIYIIGDSLTDGMRNDLTTALGTKLAAPIEATVGISIQDSVPKVNFPSDTDTVLVGLGTNNFSESATTFKNHVQSMIDKVRGIKPGIVIYWTNIYAPRSDIVAALPTINGVLSDIATQDVNFHVIDWQTEAVNNGYTFGTDQLHPKEYSKRAAFILKALGISTDPAAPTTTNTGNSYSATVWRAEKTLPADWIPILQKAGNRFGIDPSMLAALMSIETGWDTPASFATNPRRNSATATGPFQFIDSTAVSFMPAPDRLTSITDPSRYTSNTIKAVNNGSEKETDGTYVMDGNKDGKVDRTTPEDAALMASAYLKSLGASTSTILGNAGDYAVPKNARGQQLTVRLVGAYYNQGGGFSAPDAKTAADVNARAVGNNDVAHYMDQMMEVTDAGRKSGVYGLTYSTSVVASCVSGAAGTALVAGVGGWDLRGEGDHPMVYYSQLQSGSDPAVDGYYGNKPYGRGTIFECGCGPTSMAMVVSTLTPNKITPEDMAKWAADNGYQQSGCGSAWFWEQLTTESKFGIRTTAIASPDQIIESLNAGQLVIISVGHFPLPSSGDKGHISIIRKYADGGFYLADPYADGWADQKDVSRHLYSEADLASVVSKAWAIGAAK